MKLSELARRVATEIVKPAFVDDRMRPHGAAEMLSRTLALPGDIARYVQRSREAGESVQTASPAVAPVPPPPPAASEPPPEASAPTPAAPEPVAEAELPGAERVATESAAGVDDGFVFAAEARVLASGEPHIADVGDTEVALFKVGERYYATGNICPHAAGPIGEGDLDGKLVTCPFHGWIFDVTDGRCINMDGECLDTYVVKNVEGKLLVKLEER